MRTEELEKLLADVTPGEWVVTPDSDDGEMCFISKKYSDQPFPSNWIACCCTGLDQTEWESNARLIALAPTLARRVIAAEKLADIVRLVSDSFGGGLVITFSDNDMIDIHEALAEWEAAQ